MKELYRYILRFFVFSLPFTFLVVVYIIIDPFMVIFSYNDYNRRNYIPKDRDFVSTEMYLRNRDKYDYNSFIFGSSAALFVTPSIWSRYLDSSSVVFSFDASRENIYGIWSKMRFIDKTGRKINNALLVIDYDHAFAALEKENTLFIKHYKIYQSSWLDFQYKNFVKSLDPHFLRCLISYAINKEFKPFMKDCLISDVSYIDPVSNEYHNLSVKEELKNDSLRYYESRKDHFPVQTGIFREYKAQIDKNHIKALNEMHDIFLRNKTVFRIIIAPNYEQISINRNDLEVVNSIFGSENVFDFSGINTISGKMSNFYDGLHFKSYVGKEMLDIVYNKADYRLNKD